MKEWVCKDDLMAYSLYILILFGGRESKGRFVSPPTYTESREEGEGKAFELGVGAGTHSNPAPEKI
jgi:hypothetical protein